MLAFLEFSVQSSSYVNFNPVLYIKHLTGIVFMASENYYYSFYFIKKPELFYNLNIIILMFICK